MAQETFIISPTPMFSKPPFTDSPPSNAETLQIPAEKMPRNHREMNQMANLLSIY
jgi:hypothetical protein